MEGVGSALVPTGLEGTPASTAAMPALTGAAGLPMSVCAQGFCLPRRFP